MRTVDNNRPSLTVALLTAATVLSAGHHLDHVVRGNHLGWPLIREVTPFTHSLVVYPLVLLGITLSRIKGSAGRFWLLFAASGVLMLLAVHLTPDALEPPRDIIGAYRNRLIGWAAFGWLLSLIAVLLAICVHEVRSIRRTSR